MSECRREGRKTAEGERKGREQRKAQNNSACGRLRDRGGRHEADMDVAALSHLPKHDSIERTRKERKKALMGNWG